MAGGHEGSGALSYVESLLGLLSDQPPISASLPLGPGFLALALLAMTGLRLAVSFRSESNFRRLTLSGGALVITYTTLAVAAPGFSITASIGSIVSFPSRSPRFQFAWSAAAWSRQES